MRNTNHGLSATDSGTLPVVRRMVPHDDIQPASCRLLHRHECSRAGPSCLRLPPYREQGYPASHRLGHTLGTLEPAQPVPDHGTLLHDGIECNAHLGAHAHVTPYPSHGCVHPRLPTPGSVVFSGRALCVLPIRRVGGSSPSLPHAAGGKLVDVPARRTSSAPVAAADRERRPKPRQWRRRELRPRAPGRKLGRRHHGRRNVGRARRHRGRSRRHRARRR